MDRKYYESPEEAIRNGKSQKALGYLDLIRIVFEGGKTPYIAFPSTPGLPIRDAKTSEVDKCHKWSNLRR